MTWTELDTWIVATGVLGACSCALVGNYLILRGMSMMGDAISHAVLPGLALAFIFTGTRASGTMFVGAAIVGVLTAVFTQWIHTLGRVDRSASMGVVFTTLFAIGLILMVKGADHVDLDANCVLYGALELVPLDTISVGGWLVPRATLILAGMLAFNVLVIAVFYKELKISAFDPDLATTLGISATGMLYLLMALVAMTTVANFESVGSILVIAMLIVPGATAHVLTDRLPAMHAISLVVAAASALLGHVAAVVVPGWFGLPSTGSAGMIAVASGGLFTLAVLFGPQRGLLSRYRVRRALSRRIFDEDVLGVLYRHEELGVGAPPPETLADVLQVRPGTVRRALNRLFTANRAVATDGSWRLTGAGRTAARQLVRTHRLWETYLARNLHLPADHLHGAAHRLEHLPVRPETLSAALDGPEADPHGTQIPGPEPPNGL